MFNSDDTFGIGEELKHDAEALENSAVFVLHQTVITSDIGLTFGTVGNDIIDSFRIFAGQFHMSRETCAAKTDNSGCLHSV